MTILSIQLWRIFGGFYASAYLFWLGAYWHQAVDPFVAPGPFNTLLHWVDGALTVVAAFFLLWTGFQPARLPPEHKRWTDALGVAVMGIWAFKYWPAANREVPHWPFDFGITLFAAARLAYAALRGK